MRLSFSNTAATPFAVAAATLAALTIADVSAQRTGPQAGASISISPADEGKRVEGKNGVVTSANGLASEAGLEMLKAGGNAVDAAVATTSRSGWLSRKCRGLVAVAPPRSGSRLTQSPRTWTSMPHNRSTPGGVTPSQRPRRADKAARRGHRRLPARNHPRRRLRKATRKEDARLLAICESSGYLVRWPGCSRCTRNMVFSSVSR